MDNDSLDDDDIIIEIIYESESSDSSKNTSNDHDDIDPIDFITDSDSDSESN